MLGAVTSTALPSSLSSLSISSLRARHPFLATRVSSPNHSINRFVKLRIRAEQLTILKGIGSSLPPTWKASLLANATIFTLGYPLLQAGLTAPGIASAFILGTLTWRAFGAAGFLLEVFYFLLGTGVTKVKIKQKENEGIAEKRSGKRGPASVAGSGTAGSVCALAAILGLGGPAFFPLWQLGYVASFCTKLSDTVSSEIGKAFGKTTYLVTTFERVPRGTEGAVSIEGTLAGLLASILLSAFAYYLNQVNQAGAIICIVASQIANLFESYAGATFQDKHGFEWFNNDIVNIINISLGASLAITFFWLIT